MRKILSYIRTYLRWYVLLFLVIIGLILCYAVFHEDRGNRLTVTFLNVGQGNSVFIESPTGTQVIIDGGPNNNLMKEISSVLPWYDRSVDMLVISNTDQDHYDGFIPFLRKFSADVVLEPGTTNTNAPYEILEKEITDKKIPKIIGRRGQIVDLGGGAYLEVLFPDRDISGLASNNGSMITRLVYGDTSVLFQGDSPVAMEDYLVSLARPESVEWGINLKSTILLVGHHGSKTSTGENYVKSVLPQWAVISVGAGNTYGHPTQETLDTLSKYKVTTLATCTMGRITFNSDGKEFTLQNKNISTVNAGCK
jgi:competence protein ComEC